MSILVFGKNGLAGSAITRKLNETDRQHISLSRKDVDLSNFNKTLECIKDIKPSSVIVAAARVGGMVANKTYPAEFLLDNLIIQNNILKASHVASVDRLIFLGSSCIYPHTATNPIKEESLLTGPLEKTNEPYAIAKIAGLKLVQAFREEYGRDWISLMPTNLYGPGDNFDLKNSHVLAALIRKIYEAKQNGQNEITLWGSGKPRREFLHVDDFAEAVLFCLDNYHDAMPINIGVGKDVSISELSEIITKEIGFNGQINWDTGIPDGIYQKRLDVSKLSNLGWNSKIELEFGISETVSWFMKNQDSARLDVQIRLIS
jgi:GDP-L-fucose synthase